MKGGKIVIAQQEAWVEGDVKVTLDKKAVDRGLEILRVKYPWHYRSLFKGEYDAPGLSLMHRCICSDHRVAHRQRRTGVCI